MIQAGIVGGAGFTAGELIRLLLHHPEVDINFIYSTSNAGNSISDIHQDLVGDTNLTFTNQVNSNVDVLFLCLGHGNSSQFLMEHEFAEHTKIIDLSHDFRLKKEAEFQNKKFIYGLPELQHERIKTAAHIANPGCFATAIQLGLLPLAKAHLLTNDIHINAITGATGAGTSLSATTHFSWRDGNASIYKAFNHQHLDEIYQTLTQLQPDFKSSIYFIPNRGNFSRGIFASMYTPFSETIAYAIKLFTDAFKDSPFTVISNSETHLKQVVNTNKCVIHLEKSKGMLLITSIIDNLLKGASGQAVQNMNLIFGFKESTGLELKANYF